MVIYLLETLPRGKAIQMCKGSHQKYFLIMYGVSPFNLIYWEPKGFDQQSKRGCSMSSMSTINMRSKLPCPSSKELKWILRDQMILHKFKETAITPRKCESSFRETVSNPIVFSVDVDERQIQKARKNILCFPTPVKEFWWGENSRSLCLVNDDLRVTEYVG